MKTSWIIAIGMSGCLLSGCGAEDVSVNLPGGYVFYGEAPSMQWVSPATGAAAGERFVPCNVIKVCYDKDVIVAEQVNNGACNGTGSQEFLLAAEQPNETYHWVIVVREKMVLGPFTVPEYAEVARHRRISRELKCVIDDKR